MRTPTGPGPGIPSTIPSQHTVTGFDVDVTDFRNGQLAALKVRAACAPVYTRAFVHAGLPAWTVPSNGFGRSWLDPASRAAVPSQAKLSS